MKIWYQALSPNAQLDPSWRLYEEACERYVPTLARSDTTLHFASAATRAPKMVLSNYVKYLHLEQILENAIRCEREGYDAFVMGGMGDLGYDELREVVDIPVLFICETSFMVASAIARKFAIINGDRRALGFAMDMARDYGLGDRTVAGGFLGYGQPELAKLMEQEPQRIVDEFKKVAAPAIDEGAELLVPGIAPISVFLAERGVRDVKGVPILDIQAAVIKMTELAVDLWRLGMPKPARGGAVAVSKRDVELARKIYGRDA